MRNGLAVLFVYYFNPLPFEYMTIMINSTNSPIAILPDNSRAKILLLYKFQRGLRIPHAAA